MPPAIRRLLADKRIRISVIAVAAIAAYLLARALLPDVDLQDLLERVAATLGEWTYLAVSVLAFLETGAFVGLVAPGETFVILAGAVAGVGETSLALTIALVWFSAWAGDTVSFMLGRRFGSGFVLRHGRRVRITPERFEHVEGYFQRHGGKTILVGRFIGVVRALAPFVAGTSGMRYGAFAPFSVLGTGLWGGGFTLLGFFAARSLEEAAHLVGRGTFLFGLAVAVIVAIVLAVRFLREAENRARLAREMESRRGLRALLSFGRSVRPQARFVWDRVTPGGLGLEVTTLLAVLAVGLFAVVALATAIATDPAPTATDRAALRVVRDLHSSWQTEINLAITELGRASVVFSVAAVAAFVLLLRRRWAEAAVVVAAMLITAAAVDLAKEVVDRPRPVDQLVIIERPSYPSGHAAYSVLWAWLAVTVALRVSARRLGSRLTLRALIWIAGFAVAALVGLSRVYLRVHYLSDVIGGWALGVSAFALCGLVAIVVSHLRQNAPMRSTVKGG